MENDVLKQPAIQHSSQFGMIAVNKGFVTARQLKIALIVQSEDDLSNKPYRPIGKILFENGWITKEHVDIVLKELFKGHD